MALDCCGAGEHPILSDCEQARMFVRCSRPTVSTFSRIVRALATIFSPNLSRAGAMFVRRCRDVCESLHLGAFRGFRGADIPADPVAPGSPHHQREVRALEPSQFL